MPVQLVGIDCATVASRIGLAFGRYDRGRLTITQALFCPPEQPVSAFVAAAVRAVERPVLLALDAPLGWPAPLGMTLAEHQAGEPILVAPEAMFRRETDRFIHRTIGKLPLEVGADRIARTAHAALNLLAELSVALAEPIPLAWRPQPDHPLAAIEVYPAATLTVHGLPARNYKKADQQAARQMILSELAARAALPADGSSLVRSADLLDAALCLLAAADFLSGQAMPPTDEALARREGWIWVRQPAS
jgi:hypothetical protein